MRVRVLFACLVAALPGAVEATYRCVGPDGKKYYGQAVPPQCAGVLVEKLDAQGRVVRRTEAPKSVTEDDASARRDRALLATYASEAEIEDARQRALRAAENVDAAAVNARYDADLKRYRELIKLRQEPPRMQQGVRVIKPAPVKVDRRHDEQRARDVAEREAEMLRRLQQERQESSRPRVSAIDPVPPTELSPPAEDGPLTRERDEPVRFPGYPRPTTPPR